MAKYAFIQNDDTVGMIVEADSIELAQEVASNVYGTKDVVALEGTEMEKKLLQDVLGMVQSLYH
jgi:aspartate carbamoyltransferase regulatory subunit